MITTATTASSVGTYPISIAVGTLTAVNYDFPAANLVGNSLTINPAHLTVTADPKTKIYSQDNPPLTYQISGFANGHTMSEVTGSPSVITTATDISNAGTYPITVGRRDPLCHQLRLPQPRQRQAHDQQGSSHRHRRQRRNALWRDRPGSHRNDHRLRQRRHI